MIKLDYFELEEFKGWDKQASIVLLKTIDLFRNEWGKPVTISPHPNALGRYKGPNKRGCHNINYWGELLALDFFPRVMRGNVLGYMETAKERRRAFEIAKAVGFSGIGIYTDTKPGNMMHGDIRPGPIATWSRINGNYLDIQQAL